MEIEEFLLDKRNRIDWELQTLQKLINGKEKGHNIICDCDMFFIMNGKMKIGNSFEEAKHWIEKM